MSDDQARAGPSREADAAATTTTTTTVVAKRQRPTFWDGLASLSPSKQLQRFTSGKIACERQSLLLGMGTGAGVLSVGLIAQRGFRKSGNWGALAFVTVTLASFTMCRNNRQAEARKMRIIMEDFKRKRDHQQGGGLTGGGGAS